MNDDATPPGFTPIAVIVQLYESAEWVIPTIHDTSISRNWRVVKSFLARYDKIVVAVKDDGDGLALGKDASGPLCVCMNDAHAARVRVGDFDGDKALVNDVHDAKKRAG